MGNDFLKGLPSNWLLYINIMFNIILSSERMPLKWSEIIVRMLYKRKGSTDDKANYRPILLVNCLAKLFIGISGTRITKWCNTYKIIPEWQLGFREERVCRDNIFDLNTIIQLHLERDKVKLYALFIDFKGAFDSITHSLLSNIFRKIGIGSKILMF